MCGWAVVAVERWRPGPGSQTRLNRAHNSVAGRTELRGRGGGHPNGGITCPATVYQARVVKSADTRDLKSLGGNPVRVRIPPRALCQAIVTHRSVWSLIARVLGRVTSWCGQTVAILCGLRLSKASNSRPLVGIVRNHVAVVHAVGLVGRRVPWPPHAESPPTRADERLTVDCHAGACAFHPVPARWRPRKVVATPD